MFSHVESRHVRERRTELRHVQNERWGRGATLLFTIHFSRGVHSEGQIVITINVSRLKPN
jgi:hypothetical protein